MFYHAKNGNIRIGDADMDYISFGRGSNLFVMLPGLGDGLSTVKGMALAFALAYRVYAEDYSIQCLQSRKDILWAFFWFLVNQRLSVRQPRKKLSV